MRIHINSYASQMLDMIHSYLIHAGPDELEISASEI